MKDTKLPKNELIHDLNGKKSNSIDISGDKTKRKGKSNPLILIVIFTLILGVGTGYIASQTAGSSTKTPLSVDGEGGSGEIKKGATFGVDDTETFPDTAEGIVREGGIEGEGEYHLERVGGESQNVYMTSSAVDLGQLVGKKVKVWGQTQTAQTAGWLMDVGKVEIL